MEKGQDAVDGTGDGQADSLLTLQLPESIRLSDIELPEQT